MIEVATGVFANGIYDMGKRMINGSLAAKELDKFKSCLAELQQRSDTQSQIYEKEFEHLWTAIETIEREGVENAQPSRWQVIGDTTIKLVDRIAEANFWKIDRQKAAEAQVRIDDWISQDNSLVVTAEVDPAVQERVQHFKSVIDTASPAPQLLQYPTKGLVALFRQGTIAKRELQFLNAHVQQLRITAEACIEAARIVTERRAAHNAHRKEYAQMMLDYCRDVIPAITGLTTSGKSSQIEVARELLQHVREVHQQLTDYISRPN